MMATPVTAPAPARRIGGGPARSVTAASWTALGALLLREINAEGRTVLLTTHHLEEAELLCDRVAIMDHGKILQIGPPASLVRGLDSPTRISVESGVIPAARAPELFAGSEVADDGVSLTVSTRDPAAVLSTLA